MFVGILKPNFLGREEISKDHFYNKAFEAIKCAFQIEKIAGYTKKELKKYPKNGIIWSSCSPDFGAQGVVDRFKQIKPSILITSDHYFYLGSIPISFIS